MQTVHCHETRACAARLELQILVMRDRPDANVLVFQVLLFFLLKGFATLPQMKGQMGFVRIEA